MQPAMKTKDDNVFNGKKVFLAFRTTMFEKTDEHMTLKFFGNNPKWGDIICEAAKWQTMLPVEIEQVGLGVWKNRDQYHKVAHMNIIGHPALWGRSWHVTLESSLSPIPTETYIDDPEEDLWVTKETMRELWLGYKDSKGNKRWITYRNAKHLVKAAA